MGGSEFMMGDGKKRMGSSFLWMAGWGNEGCATTSRERSQVDGGLVPPPQLWVGHALRGEQPCDNGPLLGDRLFSYDVIMHDHTLTRVV